MTVVAPSTTRGWQFWIDRGGTFTDIVARRPDGSFATAKLLSEHREQYADAAVAGMRRLLGLSSRDPLPIEQIEVVKMGTTVGTNALLERKGEPTLLLITRGFRDQLRIAYQTRPKLFTREIQLPELLYARVAEVDERVGADGAVLRPLDAEQARAELQRAYSEGYRSVAIVFLHAWRYPEHERKVEALARELAFSQVSASHAVSPLLKVVQRGDTTVVDAYLSPVLRRYVQQVQRELEREGQRAPLFFMKSNGGLSEASTFRGKDSILSGPAGGIVGLVHSSLQAGFHQVIGFDMGGTSTDVSHFAGQSVADSERQFETQIAGVRVAAPMMSIHTIAAGGGSILHFDGQRFQVGPDSAGASPGPACYRRGGPLTVTDCNVLLGKLHPEFFPRVFGPAADEPIDVERVRELFAALAREVALASGRETSPEQVAEGFLRIATLNMANAIKVISIQRGHDVTRYTLSSFGGAGGQHACLVADELGMQRVYIHPYAGVLSAFGMGVADISAMREQTFERPLAPESVTAMDRELDLLAEAARAEVRAQGVSPERIVVVRRAHLKYAGTDSSLALPAQDAASLRLAFEAAYRTRFAFLMPERGLVIEALSVEAVGAMDTPEALAAPAPSAPGEPAARSRVYAGGRWQDAPIFRRQSIHPDTSILADLLTERSVYVTVS